MSDDAARVEAERRFLVVVPDLAYLRGAFIAGAAWQAAQPVAVSREQIEAVMLRHWHADDCAAWGRPPRPLASCTCWKADLRAALGITVEPTP